ncbi:MAG: lytic murein transglycosylase [Proteobacteria bacterium]|nr:lytic murein transglycosylase [Pseudomonadota bacterium]
MIRPVLAATLAATFSLAACAQTRDETCLTSLREAARAQGMARADAERLTRGWTPEWAVLDNLDNQPEFKTPIWDYLAALVDDQRIADGRAQLAAHKATLADIEQRFGVDAATVVAVWGVESNFGQVLGGRPIVASLAALACEGRRQSYFRGEWLALAKLMATGDLDTSGPEGATAIKGSWAGAFGQTQFMPSTYQRLAVDFDADGRRDLITSTPDALASTANFLVKGGWRMGQPWGYEVRLPAGFDAGDAGRRDKQPLATWAARGVTPVAGGKLTGDGPAALLLPAGREGPAFLVLRNFDVIYGYNAAESYALAIAHLADRLRGGGPFAAPWPTDDAGLSRAERREVQTLLAARGHAVGAPDGLIGPATRAAVRTEQQARGWPQDGRPGQKLLRTLRAEPAPAAASATAP